MSISHTSSLPLTVMDSEISEHPLDNVIWAALTSQHGSFASGKQGARRYPVQVAPFAAMPKPSPENFAALAELLTAQDQVALFTAEPLVPPECFELVARKTLLQMVGPATRSAIHAPHIAALGAADVTDMLALIELAQPGPFSTRTRELGNYLGIRVDGQLAAMAGERLHLDGYTEISAVCAHPASRGRGYPKDLIVTLSNAILERGEIPFLHVLKENLSAIALYEKLGFAVRRPIHLTLLRLAT